MRAIRRKARSQEGASITFALLLFLVCAIISSVVIVAATAAAGRASKMAEMDQRYYAVNSAAELLRDMLEKQSVTITLTTTTTDTVDGGHSPIPGAATTTSKALTIVEDGTTVFDSESPSASPYYSIIVDAAKAMSAAFTEYNSSSTYTYTTGPLALTAQGVTFNPNGLAVTVDLRNPSGQKLEMDVHNADATRGTYTLRLTFAFDVNVSNGTQVEYGPPIPTYSETPDEDGNLVVTGYTMSRTTINRKAETYTCKLVKTQTGIVATPTT